MLRHGQTVEKGLCEDVFKRPKTSYTQQLLSAVPLPIIESKWLEKDLPAEQFAGTTDQKESESKMGIKFQISDCTALVTGANRGIGRAFVEAILSRGARKV